jgi:hypothetical protein
MTTEPPTTPPTTDHSSTTYEPSDLLDDDGNIDTSKVKSITNENADPAREVSPTLCKQWRRIVREGTQPRNVETDFDHDSVRYHATGECDHDHGEPTATYDHDAEQWGPQE